MKDKISLSTLIAIISAIISLAVLLFGNNIYEKLIEKTDIRLQSSTADRFIPTSLIDIANAYFKKNNELNVNSLKIIKIKNTGSPSKNLRIQLNLDAKIYDYSIESAESIQDIKVSGESILNISMERLSQNAEIDLVIWLQDNNQNLQASYSDDISSSLIPINEDTNRTVSTIIMTVISMVFVQSMIYLLFKYISKRNKERKTQEKSELLNWMFAEIVENLSDDNVEDENNEEVLSASDRDKAKERLRDLIKKKN